MTLARAEAVKNTRSAVRVKTINKIISGRSFSVPCFKDIMKKYVLLCTMFLYGCTAENTPETFHSETQQSITADFDYDGFHGTYYHYNPDTEKFNEWDELNKIGRLLNVGMSENVRIGQVLSLDTDDGQRFIYKWNGSKLNLIERRETDKNTETWYYINENGNEILIDK